MRRVQPRPIPRVPARRAPPIMGLLPVTRPASEVSVTDVATTTAASTLLANNHVDWRRGVRSVVGVAGPVCVSPAWSAINSPARERNYVRPRCVAVGNTFHVLENAKIYTDCEVFREYTLKLPPPQPPTTTTPTTKATAKATGKKSCTAKCNNNNNQSGEGLWVLRDDARLLSSGHVNNKWWVCCNRATDEVYISRISGFISQRNGRSTSSLASPPVAYTLNSLKDTSMFSLFGFFFSKSNPDEAAMVTAHHNTYYTVKSFIVTVIDVERTVQAHTAKQLSKTKWMIYDCDVGIRSGMIFHNQTTGLRTFVVVTQRHGPFEPQELFVVEEDTGSQRRFEDPFEEVSQLNDTVFCVSLSSEYQLWEARVNRQQPLRRVSICSPDVVTAECGLLFHRTEHNSVINVIHASTGALILSFKVPPQATTHISGFLL
ncbi:hypothetical protein Pelo_17664 [Pelomyxa schiedti]|nr:hypothetical protein Pelo_17664 [Pelomyxa schiedti]